MSDEQAIIYIEYIIYEIHADENLLKALDVAVGALKERVRNRRNTGG